MHANRFDRAMWRINGLLILALGVAGAVSVAEQKIDEWRDPPSWRSSSPASGSPAQPGLLESEALLDERWLVFPYTTMGLGGWQGRRAGEVATDLLLLDTVTLAQFWLIGDPEATLVGWWPVSGHDRDDDDPGLVACHLAHADGTHEFRVADLVRGTVGTVATGAVRRLRISSHGDRLFCMYEGEAGLVSAVFALDEGMACLDRQPVPAPPGRGSGGEG